MEHFKKTSENGSFYFIPAAKDIDAVFNVWKSKL